MGTTDSNRRELSRSYQWSTRHVHLVGNTLKLKRKVPTVEATEVLDRLVDCHSDELPRLESPADYGDMTVVDVAAADDLDEHSKLVLEWAHSAWAAWEHHHERSKSGPSSGRPLSLHEQS
ncbi:DUF5946 family protein [Natrinema sp. SYSU A 869]|uniref:DUF5946 family protein n=1 Tax=Natrinema sp. SYSU A 869 TaxID=2871694 RepID=UPI001CA38BAD|nr:DUF5946 family protein [Natrinema sp. SYSU A 869]